MAINLGNLIDTVGGSLNQAIGYGVTAAGGIRSIVDSINPPKQSKTISPIVSPITPVLFDQGAGLTYTPLGAGASPLLVSDPNYAFHTTSQPENSIVAPLEPGSGSGGIILLLILGGGLLLMGGMK